VNRRQLLAAAAAGATGFAGCNEDSEKESPTGTSNGGSTPTDEPDSYSIDLGRPSVLSTSTGAEITVEPREYTSTPEEEWERARELGHDIDEFYEWVKNDDHEGFEVSGNKAKENTGIYIGNSEKGFSLDELKSEEAINQAAWMRELGFYWTVFQSENFALNSKESKDITNNTAGSLGMMIQRPVNELTESDIEVHRLDMWDAEKDFPDENRHFYGKPWGVYPVNIAYDKDRDKFFNITGLGVDLLNPILDFEMFKNGVEIYKQQGELPDNWKEKAEINYQTAYVRDTPYIPVKVDRQPYRDLDDIQLSSSWPHYHEIGDSIATQTVWHPVNYAGYTPNFGDLSHEEAIYHVANMFRSMADNRITPLKMDTETELGVGFNPDTLKGMVNSVFVKGDGVVYDEVDFKDEVTEGYTRNQAGKDYGIAIEALSERDENVVFTGDPLEPNIMAEEALEDEDYIMI